MNFSDIVPGRRLTELRTRQMLEKYIQLGRGVAGCIVILYPSITASHVACLSVQYAALA